jgi:hypothetical protein
VQQSFGDGLIAVHWSADEPGSAAYITLFTPDGAEVETYSTGGRFLLAGAWISDGVLAANVGVEASELDAQAPQFFPSLLPALIDFDAHTINPITDPFLLPGMEAGRNLVRGIQRLE